ncbi:hypothetical protein IRY44_24980 [Micromonospora sp. ANENR4]|uniref:hypothetical protein n=1 Tax=Micromonospora sp. ANENR4 TaxID=2783662 RepID=UPI001890170F|nr:hypothetical protein [Micromonospora sp. ANENR4]MBF5033013.1 hypothetical protein [Micromonospora sp. ANENR4]
MTTLTRVTILGGSAAADIDVEAVTDDGGRRRGTATIPRLLLNESGFLHGLGSNTTAGLAEAGQRYAQVLLATIARASGFDHVTLADDAVVLVCGKPQVHQWVWEALRLPLPGRRWQPRAVTVARTPSAPGGASPAPMLTAASLTWVGARPLDGDAPRYSVLGPVLASVLQPGGRLSIVTARTDFHVGELDRAISPPDGPGLRILHLDGHGISSMKIGDGEIPVDHQFGLAVKDADDRAVVVPDTYLLHLAASASYDAVITNACFGAQQRSASEFSMPAQAVAEGRRFAIAAREPLARPAATLFFAHFYGLFGCGVSLGDSFARACAMLGKAAIAALFPDSKEHERWDQAARLLAQPVLWLRASADVGLVLPEPAEDARTSSPVLDYLPLMGSDQSVSALASFVEDRAWTGPGRAYEAAAHEICDMAPDDVDQLTGLLRKVFGAVGDGPEPETLRFLGITHAEAVAHISTRFAGSSLLYHLLGFAAPRDLISLDALARHNRHDAASALLHVLSWGPDNPDTGGRGDAGRRLAVLARAAIDGALPPEARDDAFVFDSLTTSGVVTLGLPLFRLGEATDEIPVPDLFLGDQAFLEAIDEAHPRRYSDGAAVDASIRHAALRPWDQLAIRRLVEPRQAALALVIWGGTATPETAATEIPLTERRCAAVLARLSAAVAARQAGTVDVASIVWIDHALNGSDRQTVHLLCTRLHAGLPGWAPLSPETDAEYTRITRITGTNDSQVDIDDSSAGQAHKLFHEGRHEEALNQARERLSAEPGGDAHGARILEAFALIKLNRIDEATRTVASLIRAYPGMVRWNQCETLHLLGELAAANGNLSLAIEYFIQEQALGPPSRDRRLHNRHHLLTTMLSAGVNYASLAVVAREGAQLASDLDNRKMLQYFVEFWTYTAAVGASREELSTVLTTIDKDPRVADSATLRFARGVLAVKDENTHTATQILTEVATADCHLSGAAAFVLARVGLLPPDQAVNVLRVGVTSEAAIHRYRDSLGARSVGVEIDYTGACAIALADQLARIRDFDALRDLPEEVCSALPQGVRTLIRAAIDHAEGRIGSAVETASSAVAVLGAREARDSTIHLLRCFSPEDSDRIILNAATKLLERILRGDNTDRDPTGLPVLTALKHLAEIVDDYLIVGRPVTDLLLEASERHWDRAELQEAEAARALVCRIMEKSSDFGTAERAEQLGYLAAVVRQRGRLAEAETLYQAALDLGRDSLGTTEFALLVGRYGNLLHATGDYVVAVVLQWHAVCRIRRQSGELMPITTGNIALLLDWRTVPWDFSINWCNLLTNLANCLFAAGQVTLCRAVHHFAEEAALRTPVIKFGERHQQVYDNAARLRSMIGAALDEHVSP